MPKSYVDFETPIGRMRVVGDSEHVDRVDLPKSAGCRPDPSWKEARGKPPAALGEARRQLTEYFAGRRRAFDLPLAAGGTLFQQRVWDALRRIPYGETISYGELARRIGRGGGPPAPRAGGARARRMGRPRASRAVGAANGRNPIAIVVPCHRVIGADGTLIGYGGGLPVKEALLALERRAAQC